jgi:hypothetical protein
MEHYIVATTVPMLMGALSKESVRSEAFFIFSKRVMLTAIVFEHDSTIQWGRWI